jgi:hypothetical protein
LQKRFDFGRTGSLLNRKTVKRAYTKVVFAPTEQQLKAAKHWSQQVRHVNFKKAKEEEIRSQFIQNVLVTILGYTPIIADGTYTIAEEQTLGKGSVDMALGEFSGKNRLVLAPFELKGPKTHDLDAIMPGRNKSPVQQAWEYAIDAPGAKWVLVSNCSEIRLYAFGHGREHYEIFDLALLDDPYEHERLWLILGAKHLLSGHTENLLAQSAVEQKDITDKLYVDYKQTRDLLITTLQVPPHGLPASCSSPSRSERRSCPKGCSTILGLRKAPFGRTALGRTSSAFSRPWTRATAPCKSRPTTAVCSRRTRRSTAWPCRTSSARTSPSWRNTTSQATCR